MYVCMYVCMYACISDCCYTDSYLAEKELAILPSMHVGKICSIISLSRLLSSELGIVISYNFYYY